jgi:hypothetical protein
MDKLQRILANTFITILGTFTASVILYTWYYAITLYC